MSDIQLAVKPANTHAIHNFGSGNFECRSGQPIMTSQIVFMSSF